MNPYVHGQKVTVISSFSDLDDVTRFLLPITSYGLLGKVVTILDQPIPDWPLYRIEEDGGHHLYPARFFKPADPAPKPSDQHKWTDEELDKARRLICELLICPDKHHCPDASYRFVDLVTPYLTGKLKDGKPRVLLIRTSMRGLDVHVYSGIPSPHDEPDTLIGMAVCLCKAKGKDIPEWILHPTDKKAPAKCH